MLNKPLRIGFAAPDFVTEKHFDSGIATYVYRTAKALIARGHEVHVVTKSDRERASFCYEGIHVHRVTFGKTWLEINRLSRYRLSTTMHLLGLSSQVYLKLRQLHRQRAFDLFQFPNCSSCGLFAILFLRVPHVLRLSWYQALWKRTEDAADTVDCRLEGHLERLQLRWSTHIYAPSVRLKEVLRDQQSVKDVAVIRNPIVPDNRALDSAVYDRHLKDKDYFLFFGRFDRHKGFHILAKAVPEVLREYPTAHCVLIGRDKAVGPFKSMADSIRATCADVGERLIILPPVSHSQLYPIISNSRLVVLPSLVDNLPNACLEAMTMGKPVIGTRGASFDEIITDGVDGFLVEPNDSGALAARIKQAWAHPDLDAIGKAATARILDFCGEEALDNLLRYYENVLQSVTPSSVFSGNYRSLFRVPKSVPGD